MLLLALMKIPHSVHNQTCSAKSWLYRTLWYGSRAHEGGGMDGCVFCQIARGEIRSEFMYQDAEVIGLMDICPIRPGHAQIIPREHFDYFDDLPDVIACRIIHLGQRLARALKTLYGVPRVAFLFSGGDHAHAHAHVIPMHEKTDITSRRYIAEETLTFRSVARALRGVGRHCRAAP